MKAIKKCFAIAQDVLVFEVCVDDWILKCDPSDESYYAASFPVVLFTVLRSCLR